MFLLIKKRKKNIAIIIHARNSSSDFYFGHFAGAKDNPQSCMLISLHKISHCHKVHYIRIMFWLKILLLKTHIMQKPIK